MVDGAMRGSRRSVVTITIPFGRSMLATPTRSLPAPSVHRASWGQLSSIRKPASSTSTRTVEVIFEINPVSFKARATSFGVALAVHRITDLLYAQVADGLNIVDGRSERIKQTVTLSYSSGFIGVNSHLNHIYLSAGRNSIECVEGNNGMLLKTLTLASGANIVSLGADQGARAFTHSQLRTATIISTRSRTFIRWLGRRIGAAPCTEHSRIPA